MSTSLTVGTDPAGPVATRGYALNHFALIVHDMDAMFQFYGDVLGMRHIMTQQVSPVYNISYMGYPVGSTAQTGAEMLRELRYRDGLLEFLHPIDAAGDRKASGRIGRFSHMGIVVPDIKAAEARMQALGIPILKGLGVDTIEPGSSVAEWWGLDEAHVLDSVTGVKEIAFGEILLVLDPEGNVVEMQERK